MRINKIVDTPTSMKNKKRKGRIKTIVLLSTITLLALIPRVWKLKNYPPLIVDEPADLRDINLILENGFNPLAFHWDWSKSFLGYLPAYLLIKLLNFPPTILTLRYTSVLISLLGLPPLFFIVKKHTNTLTAFNTTLLYSFSYYFLQFSRVGGWMNVILVNTIGLYVFWIVERAVKKKSLGLIILSAALTSLLFYIYRSGWIYIGASFIFLFLSLIRNKYTIKKFITFIGSFFCTFLLLITPWLLKIKANRSMYMLRANVVSINNVKTPYHGLYQKTDIYLYQLITTANSWLLLRPVDGGGHENPRYLPLSFPPVNNLVRVGFWAGLVIAVFSIKETYSWYLILALGMIFGQILTNDPPNGARGLIMLPFIYLFFSLSLYKLFSFSKNKFYRTLILALVLTISYFDFTFYQHWMTWIRV